MGWNILSDYNNKWELRLSDETSVLQIIIYILKLIYLPLVFYDDFIFIFMSYNICVE